MTILAGAAMQPRYDIFELDAHGRRRRCIAADQLLEALEQPAIASRIEAHNTNTDGHCYHWDDAEWQPCPHPIHMARSSVPAGALMSEAGRQRHYARAVRGARLLAHSGVTVAEVDAQGVTVVVHDRRSDGDEVQWPHWAEARLAEARARRLGGPQEIGLCWLDLEQAMDSTDADQAQFYAALYDVATNFRAANSASDSPAVMRERSQWQDLYHLAS